MTITKNKNRNNKDSSINYGGVSKCCEAPIKAKCGDDFGDDAGKRGSTCYMECQKCFNPTDPTDPKDKNQTFNKCEHNLHNFMFSGKFIEATQDNYIYHEVSYSICSKCGEVRKNNL